MNWLLISTYVAVLGATALLLLGMYRSRGGAGYLVLLVALPMWPVLGNGVYRLLITPGIDRLIDGEAVSLWPFSLVSSGAISIGELVVRFSLAGSVLQSALTLVGIWLLRARLRSPPNTRLQRTGAEAPAAEPQGR